MSDLPTETETFVAELNVAVEAHMAWSRRMLRCAVLRTVPDKASNCPRPIHSSPSSDVSAGSWRVNQAGAAIGRPLRKRSERPSPFSGTGRTG